MLHWFALPLNVRNAIWREYRPGQENDKKPSLRYMAVQRLACALLADGEEVAAEKFVYFQEASRFQRAAVAAGLGDPLEGLLEGKQP